MLKRTGATSLLFLCAAILSALASRASAAMILTAGGTARLIDTSSFPGSSADGAPCIDTDSFLAFCRPTVALNGLSYSGLASTAKALSSFGYEINLFADQYPDYPRIRGVGDIEATASLDTYLALKSQSGPGVIMITWLVTRSVGGDGLYGSTSDDAGPSVLVIPCSFGQCELRSEMIAVTDLGAPFRITTRSRATGTFSGQTSGSITFQRSLHSVKASSNGVDFFAADFQEVPEPANGLTILLGGILMAAAAVARRRRRSSPDLPVPSKLF